MIFFFNFSIFYHQINYLTFLFEIVIVIALYYTMLDEHLNFYITPQTFVKQFLCQAADQIFGMVLMNDWSGMYHLIQHFH